MRIKRLEIKGFKSFADKTEMVLADGITAVVGPNGSGKSNLADAIRWVLGEQSAKALRSSRMDEVIFAGTRQRRGHSMAEVSLVFDNESGQFPLAFNEIVISRRIYKTGESEYYINRTRCRLKDLQDLFLDTGIGKDAYSFIGQGRIQELLSIRPEDRRGIFEEVAGVAKYKSRKRETANKLRDAQSALTRVNDLVYELRLEEEPLREEAKRAQEYLRLQAELKDAEKQVLLYELNMLERRLERDGKQREQLQDLCQQRQNSLIAIEVKEEKRRLEMSRLQENIDNNTQLLLSLTKQRERVDSEQRFAKSQAVNLREKLSSLQSREQELRQSQQQIAQEYREAEEAVVSLQSAIAEQEMKANDMQQQLESLSGGRLDDKMQQAQAALRQLEVARNEVAVHVGVKQDRVAHLRQERNSLLQQIETTAARLQEEEAAWHQIEVQRQQVEQRRSRLAQEHQALEARREDLAAHLATANEKWQCLLQGKAALDGKLGLLCDVVDGLEGYQRGVRNLLQARQRGVPSLQGIIGVVGDLLQVPAAYEIAIEAALGGSIQFLVSETEDDARRGIEYLKKQQMGRATFLPLDVVKPRNLTDSIQAAVQMGGAVGLAADLVQYDARLSDMVYHLLGNIVVVEQLPQAIAIARHTRHRVRLVTLEGDVLMPGGSLSGGSRQQKGGGLLSRQRELASLQSQQQLLVEQCEQQEAVVKRYQAELQQVQAASQSVERELNGQAALLREITTQLAALAQSRDEQKSRLAEREEELRAVESEIDATHATLAQSEAELAAAIAEQAEHEHLLSELQQATAGSGQRRLQLQSQLHDIELELVSLREQRLSRQRELKRLTDSGKELQSNLESLLTQQRAVEDEIRAGCLQMDRLQQAMQELVQSEASCQEELTTAKAMASRASADLQAIRQQIKDARVQLDESKTQLYNVELRLSRLEADYASLLQRLRRDFSVEDREGLHSTLASRAQGEEQLQALQEELLHLGPVRVGALQELERLTERITFLHNQAADLVASCASLEKIIQEVDELMSKRFLDAFEQVRRAFQRLFRELFGGGEAELQLSEPDLPLETGIEIMAQPPGKKLQNINLLSGGEKALTALALLCATLEVKPTPFCVLDEIDASLDETNTRRFMQVISRLAEQTQFIIITHAKETMLAVDTLYGVTMPEQGISQLISVNLNDVD